MKFLRDSYFLIRHLGRGVPRSIGKHDFRFDESLRRWNFDQEAEVRDGIESNLGAGETAIDIGANFGMHTLLMADCVGSNGNVIALEPIPENLRLLRRNIALNRFDDRVQITASAISDLEQPTLQMEVDSDNLEPSAAISMNENAVGTIEVQNQSLDSITTHLTNPGKCFVKIDVEGAEMSVLRSGIDFLKRVRPKLLIEVHDYALPQFGESTESVYAFLREHGFEIGQLSDMANHNGQYHHILATPS
ncbi:FkbM family methyltransferase [Rhodopirellula bahusiensis]|uniref:Methyltransferase FkbM domain-containing protein n=1 Tax=Rhodopirellula bahusiensis TaxID=2014065 RepID=A0A2G1WDT9_9BACT|nr:FkbM family methyltransferase [Rhodopirellula bahusiensis]PHQ36749.1 hypothetical protein CEE69_05260 [Rhodopirellula bahusiensis]